MSKILLNPAYVNGKESGEKYKEYVKIYGGLDPKTQYWASNPYREGSQEAKYFDTGFKIGLI